MLKGLLVPGFFGEYECSWSLLHSKNRYRQEPITYRKLICDVFFVKNRTTVRLRFFVCVVQDWGRREAPLLKHSSKLNVLNNFSLAWYERKGQGSYYGVGI